MYNIEEKSGINGNRLVVNIPEGAVDTTALRVIQSDIPKFLIPFSTRTIDGVVEISYQLGALNPIRYFGGVTPPEEYIKLWLSVVEPLLECEDWFLNPFCFVFDTDKLYYDNASANVRYLYIPSVVPVSDDASLKAMIGALAQQKTTTDSVLETTVLRAAMTFNSGNFVKTLKSYKGNAAPPRPPVPAAPPVQQSPQAPQPVQFRAPEAPPAPPPVAAQPVQVQKPAVAASDDIIIKTPQKTPAAKTPKASKTPKPPKTPKAPKPQKEPSKGFSLFKSKKPAPEQAPLPPVPQKQEYAPQPNNAYAAQTPELTQVQYGGDKTVIDFRGQQSGARLRLDSYDKTLPPNIQLPEAIGEEFQIGRFDVQIGQKQSDFEFGANTKAVSRRHAVLKRTPDGYTVRDLNSAAGTYINGQRAASGSECLLSVSSRISFGNAGADYILEM
ncbi:MAG: FHA domain-containing protein [Oscillospiraceae bacterium]|jgi:hypothetical protein|nr:FHA domain-containing protein [Oscillospiraceae bacterium]